MSLTPVRRHYGLIFIVSLLLLMLETSTARVLSVSLHSHYAFVAISLAMFGLGLGSLYVYLLPGHFRAERLDQQLIAYTWRFGLAAAPPTPPPIPSVASRRPPHHLACSIALFMQRSKIAAILVLAVVTACGDGSSLQDASIASISKAQAFRFLNQATFGATEAEAERLIALGNSATAYSRWIDEQMELPASTQLAYVQAARPIPPPPGFDYSRLHFQRRDIWFQNSVRGSDQLRQRVAWALSQILVTSQVSLANRYPFGLADYYDMLARHAFGDFRQLIEDGHAAPDDGRLSLDAGQPEAERGAQYPPRRELRARAHAALHDRPGRAQRGRHAEAGRPQPADPDVRPGGRRRVRARVHGMALGVHLRFARKLRLQQHPRDGAEPDPADAAVPRGARHRREAAAHLSERGEECDPGGPDRGAGSRRCARQHLPPSERRAVHLPPADPAARDEQSVACVRRARERSVRRRRHRAARQSGGGRARDPSRRGGACACEHRGPRRQQAQGAGAAAHAALARLRRQSRERPVLQHQPRRGLRAGAAAGALRVQLLSVPSTRRPARSRTWGWSRRSCRSRRSTRTRWSRTTSTAKSSSATRQSTSRTRTWWSSTSKRR